ncbi:MAG: kynureninase, partial [Bacteroidota bacterium]
MTQTYEPTRDFAHKLDQADPLSSYRDRFYLPLLADGSPYYYFTGNSLGCQPKSLRSYLETEVLSWEKLAVEGHFHGKNPWLPYHEFLTPAMARIVGAKEEEVIMMNSLTVNLHLMMVSFYRPTASRNKILIEADAFPSDIYAVSSQIAFHGYDPKDSLIMLRPRQGEHALRTEDILQTIEEEGDSIAMVMFGGVNYYTGQVFEFEKIVKAGQAKGCVVGFDLAHTAGNIPLKLHDWNVDFACWCSYKYLNGGPGGVAGAFVHERHMADESLPRFAGWWGHDKATRFKMEPDFVPIPTAEGWQLSNAPVLSMAALKASL